MKSSCRTEKKNIIRIERKEIAQRNGKQSCFFPNSTSQDAYTNETNVREMSDNTYPHCHILRSTMGIDLNCNVMRQFRSRNIILVFDVSEINIFALKKHSSTNGSLDYLAHKVFYDIMQAPLGRCSDRARDNMNYRRQMLQTI